MTGITNLYFTTMGSTYGVIILQSCPVIGLTARKRKTEQWRL